jgi:hypothetical protein
MTISEALTQYLELGSYFDPEYGRENEALNSFKRENPILSVTHAQELIDILKDLSGDNKRTYFVADLAYLYNSLPIELVIQLLNTAAAWDDRSFNRIFLRPCLTSLPHEKITWLLRRRFRLYPTGVKSLVYHLNTYGVDTQSLTEYIDRVNKPYKTHSLLNSVQNVWIRIIVSLLVGSFANEILFMVTGNPTRERTEPNLSLLYALIIFIILTIVIKRKQKNAN